MFLSAVPNISSTTRSTTPSLVSVELSAYIYDMGIVLAGGGALLPGLDMMVTQRTGIRTFVAKNPIDCVAHGIGRVIESGQLSDAVTFRTR